MMTTLLQDEIGCHAWSWRGNFEHVKVTPPCLRLRSWCIGSGLHGFTGKLMRIEPSEFTVIPNRYFLFPNCDFVILNQKKYLCVWERNLCDQLRISASCRMSKKSTRNIHDVWKQFLLFGNQARHFLSKFSKGRCFTFWAGLLGHG